MGLQTGSQSACSGRMLQSQQKGKENNHEKQREGGTWVGQKRGKGKGEQDQVWGKRAEEKPRGSGE